MPDGFGFFDASCPKCKRRYGWSGTVKDRPPCPKCGYRVPPAPPAKEKERKETDADPSRN
jgi:PHP family Zn ribbon phosphoesterase